MRPQQQNRRMRGRGNNNNNNNNRKGPNPLTRNYESNGPDVKIRGSAQQIAEKYATLARDAQSSGDRVMAENYLQHAEHYNRIIAAAQAQLGIQQQRELRDDQDDEDDREEGESQAADSGERREDANGGQRRDHNEDRRREHPRREARSAEDGSGPQPVIDGVPAEVALIQQSENAGDPDARTANGTNGTHAEGSEDQAPRRPRRPRRPRASQDVATVPADGDVPAAVVADATQEALAQD